MRDPLAPAECRYGQQHVRGKSAAQQVLGELLAVSGVPHLLEIGRMQRIHQGMFCFTEKQRIVDGEGPVQKWQQQHPSHQYGRRRQPEDHARGLAR